MVAFHSFSCHFNSNVSRCHQPRLCLIFFISSQCVRRKLSLSEYLSFYVWVFFFFIYLSWCAFFTLSSFVLVFVFSVRTIKKNSKVYNNITNPHFLKHLSPSPFPLFYTCSVFPLRPHFVALFLKRPVTSQRLLLPPPKRLPSHTIGGGSTQVLDNLLIAVYCLHCCSHLSLFIVASSFFLLLFVLIFKDFLLAFSWEWCVSLHPLYTYTLTQRNNSILFDRVFRHLISHLCFEINNNFQFAFPFDRFCLLWL